MVLELIPEQLLYIKYRYGDRRLDIDVDIGFVWFNFTTCSTLPVL